MIYKSPEENFNDTYYHFKKDVLEYPNAGMYVVWSRRGPGKTYSFLRYMIDNDLFFIYMKRTNDDVEMICNGADNPDQQEAADPFSPLRRDFGWNIYPKLIEKGRGAFYETDEDGKPTGKPLGLIVSMNRVSKLKGMSMDRASWICFDEFIPQATETGVRKKEGYAFADFCMTVMRDKAKRGQRLQIALFANAEDISTPVTNAFEIVDDMAELCFRKQSHYFNRDRRILMHHITEQEIPLTAEEKQSDMYVLMRGTAWAQKAFYGDFANNDFTCIKKMSIKNMQCIHKIHYKNKDIYVYRRSADGFYYLCYSKGNYQFAWDLNRENDQKRFWIEHAQELRYECIDDKMLFEKYTMYDLIVNYKKFFEI